MHLDLDQIEAEVAAVLLRADQDDGDAPDLDVVCHALTGGGPQLAPIRAEGRTRKRAGAFRVELRLDVYGTARGRQVLGHELGHVWGLKYLGVEVSEEWCDAFGAMLSAPRRAVRRAIAEVGQRPSLLAPLLDIEAPAALLRIGETTGRPVAFERRRGALVVRGEPFPWPPVASVLRGHRPGLHPVRLGGRWGLMAEAG